MQPPRTLTSRQLTLFIIVMIFCPISCGLLLSYVTRRIPEPELPALVRLHSMWITPSGNKDDRRMVPCVTVKNPTQESWRNLSVGLNEQFYCSDPKELRAGEVRSLPLEDFVARNGSVRFPVGNREIKLVTVFAQINSGARAVSEHDMQGRSTVRPESDGDEIWVNGVRQARKTKADGRP